MFWEAGHVGNLVFGLVILMTFSHISVMETAMELKQNQNIANKQMKAAVIVLNIFTVH